MLRGYGGIGRRAGFRFLWATVQVQLLLSAPKKRWQTKCLPTFFLFIADKLQELRGDKQQKISFCCAGRRTLPPT